MIRLKAEVPFGVVLFIAVFVAVVSGLFIGIQTTKFKYERIMCEQTGGEYVRTIKEGWTCKKGI